MLETNPYKLIELTATRVRARMRENVLWPAVPPALAIAAAALLGRLPVEIGAAATIGFGLVFVHLASQCFERREAAAYLDRELGAKEHFLTLATIAGDPTLRATVEERAIRIASTVPPPSPPPRRARPTITSAALSLALLAFLWWLPQISLLAASGGALDRIAAELAGSSDTTDRRLGAELAALSDKLRDPGFSKDDRQKAVAEMMQKIEQAEKEKQQSAAGSSGSGGQSGKQGEQQKPEGEQQGQGKGKGSKQEQAGGEQSSGSGARGAAQKELQKIAGELAGGEQKNQQQGKSEQGKEKKPEPAGGGIKGPEDTTAKERKPGDREATGNQPGKNPDQSGGNEKTGGTEGQAKADQSPPQQPGEQQSSGQGQGQGSGEGEGASKQPSHQPSDKPAERFYKPGEGPGGRIVDGRYVRIRVPEEQRRLAGSEEVGTPGEVIPEVPYGNAPLPPPGGPGDVGTEQPVPLEYRGALGAPK